MSFFFAYDKKGRLKSKIIPGVAQVNYTYDKADRLLSKTLSAGGHKPQLAVLATYTYDKLDRRTTAKILDTSWLYNYDNRDQIIKAVATGSATPNKFLYRYDPIGNRTKYLSNPPPQKTTYISNNLNQYTDITVGGASLPSPSYDVFGNMTQCSLGFQPETSWTYSWNLHNRLVAAKSADTRLTFTYDPKVQSVPVQITP